MSQHSVLTRPAVEKPASLRETDLPSENLLNDIRALIARDDVQAARRLAAEAAKRYPDDAELVNAHRILNTGRSHTRPGTGRNTREEFEWLRDPPERYRGKWVALVGRNVVGAAETLKELLAKLPSHLEKTPLTVQVAP